MTGTKEDRSYIKKLLMIAIPIMVQNGISNFVNLLDNLMIGRVGTNALSGVAIANQLTFVFYLVIFGATAGVGIFTAQYKGKGDDEGIRYSFRFKIVFNTPFQDRFQHGDLSDLRTDPPVRFTVPH